MFLSYRTYTVVLLYPGDAGTCITAGKMSFSTVVPVLGGR